MSAGTLTRLKELRGLQADARRAECEAARVRVQDAATEADLASKVAASQERLHIRISNGAYAAAQRQGAGSMAFQRLDRALDASRDDLEVAQGPCCANRLTAEVPLSPSDVSRRAV